MFDSSLAEPGSLAGVDDAALIEAVSGWAQIESVAAARRLAAIAELVARRSDRPADAGRWACDCWDATAAEVAAAANTSHRMASNQMYLAVALRNRIPQVGKLFLDGAISARLASTIAWHTTLISDPATVALVDTELAALATQLGPLSAAKAATVIEALVERHDPEALRRSRAEARGREVVVNITETRSGVTPLWGRLFATDAAALDRRLTLLARAVCADDPRTLAQRRADALGALAAGTTLVCRCGRTDCPAADPSEDSGVVIHVVAESAALEARSDPHINGEPPVVRPRAEGATPGDWPAATREPDPPAVTTPATIVGGGSIPASAVAELINRGAVVRPLSPPEGAAAELRYRPGPALAAFIRCRDLTCRFPGCDRPAVYCDIDHAVAYPAGATHPSNLRCLCRKHHLLKTFWSGWRDVQQPDGTIVWTAPTGHRYVTRPGSAALFPGLVRSTGAAPTARVADPADARRTLMMPLRKRTRAQNRAGWIAAERARNVEQAGRAEPGADGDKPPPG